MAGNWGESAIRSFATVSDVLNKRELMAQNEADRRLREEERIANKPLLEETRKYNMDLVNQKRNEIFDSQTAPLIASAMDKTAKGLDLDEDETRAVFMAKTKATNWMNATPEEVTKLNRNLRIVGDKVRSLEPQIMAAMKNKKAVNISRESEPDFFSALDSLPAYGGAAQKGTDADGREVKKTLERATITPEGMMVLTLRVEQPDGKVYFAPATAGRDANPNAPVLQIPIAMFGAKLQQETKFADTLDSLMKKYGNTAFGKEELKHREAVKSSEAHLAGEVAVHEYLAKNPEKKDDVNAIRSAYTMAAREKAKALGVTLSQTDLHNGATVYLQGKSTKGEPTEKKRELDEYQKLTPAEKEVWKELNPKKDLNAEKPAKPPTKAEINKAEDAFGTQLFPALLEHYPDTVPSKKPGIGDFTKLTPKHKEAIAAGRKMLKEGSTPGEAADSVVEALGTPPEPPAEKGWWDTVSGAVKRVLGPKPDEKKPEATGPAEKQLSGKAAGRYNVDGKVVKWDGKKVIP